MVPFVHIISILKYKEKMTNVTSTITYVIVIKYNFKYKIIQQYKSKNITHRVLLLYSSQPMLFLASASIDRKHASW